MNLLDFMWQFDTEDKCLAYLEALRWDMKCKRCGNRMTKLKNRKEYWCSLSKCRYHQSLTNWTIFHRSSTSLQKWFLAIHIISNSKKWMSAKQLSKEVKVTYKTARRMFHQIRKLMKHDVKLFKWISEVDETYIWGKKKWGRLHGWQKHKTMVFWILNRDSGQVVGYVWEKATSHFVETHILTHVKKKSRICSDEWKWYKSLGLYYQHDTVCHSQYEWAVWDTTTNSIEWFWSQLKRGILWIYHHVSRQRMQSYVNEFCFRYNHRKSEGEIFTILLNKI